MIQVKVDSVELDVDALLATIRENVDRGAILFGDRQLNDELRRARRALWLGRALIWLGNRLTRAGRAMGGELWRNAPR